MVAWLRKPLPATLMLVLLWTVCRLWFLAHRGVPQPVIQDEFSYLLGADTFAHGRMANPPPPLGKFFESPHILVRPTYASKYPPGQALFLALGQSFLGSPFYGVPIGNALMLFAICLMLTVWVPLQWAVSVSTMFALCLQPSMYWTNSYLGGSVAASGGALVLLGIGLYRKKPTPVAGVTFALGALLLFWTRPFEGGVFTITVLVVFAREIWRNRRVGVLVATVSVLAAGGLWTCYDNRAVTGDPLLLPYLLHDRQYNATPVFWFLPLRAGHVYSHPRLASEHGVQGWEASVYRENRNLPAWQFFGFELFESVLTLSPSLRIGVLLALLVPVAWRQPLYRRMVAVIGVFTLALAAETFHSEHYAAPVWPALALMIAVWAQRAWSPRVLRQPVGAATVILALASPAIVSIPHHLSRLSAASSSQGRGSETVASSWSDRRAALIRGLSALSRRQLVIVRYPSPDWNVVEEWVYNGADIDRQQVVFAHDLGPEQNRELLKYYPDRRALLLTFDAVSGQERMVPYPSPPGEHSHLPPADAAGGAAVR